MGFVGEVVNHHVAQFTPDFARLPHSGGAIDECAHPKDRILTEREGTSDAAPLHDLGIGSNDDVAVFRVQRGISQSGARGEVNALQGAMNKHPSAGPCFALLLRKGPEPPNRFESRQIAFQTLTRPLKQGWSILEQIWRWSLDNVGASDAMLGHNQSFVVPSLTLAQRHHNIDIGLYGKQAWMDLEVRFGLQQIFPLICNGPDPKVQSVLRAQCIQRMQVLGGGSLQKDG